MKTGWVNYETKNFLKKQKSVFPVLKCSIKFSRSTWMNWNDHVWIDTYLFVHHLEISLSLDTTSDRPSSVCFCMKLTLSLWGLKGIPHSRIVENTFSHFYTIGLEFLNKILNNFGFGIRNKTTKSKFTKVEVWYINPIHDLTIHAYFRIF